jgi:iron(III) transport system permease protein
VQGFRGAVLVMTLAVYPLVYLPGRGQLPQRRPRPGGGGAQPRPRAGATFWRVTLRQARTAILGGCVLVALVLLAEYGAFEILGYQTFTTEIFTEFNVSFNVPTHRRCRSCSSSLSLVVLGGETCWPAPGSGQPHGPLAQRVGSRHRLGRAKLPVLAGFAALVGLALGVPIGSSDLLDVRGWPMRTLTGASLLDAAWHTAFYSGVAAALATLMALPVAVLAIRHRGSGSISCSSAARISCWRCPARDRARAVSYFTERYANGFGYQSAPLLVIAYAILFFPLALVGVRASVAMPRSTRGGRPLARSGAACRCCCG